MVTITPQQVQKLREITSAGILDCKKALESCDGDHEKAIQFLREKGKASAAKKAGRSAGEGLISCVISADKKKGGIVELNCETDFVARTKGFQEFSKQLALTASEKSIVSAEILAQTTLNNSTETADGAVKEKIGQLGENMKIKRAASFSGTETFLSSYIHSPAQDFPECGKLGVLLEISSGAAASALDELGKELCMQVAAANPKWVKKEDVPSDIVEKEKAIYLEQCKQSGKPEIAWPKILDGKLNDFFKQFCLLQQGHVRDSSGKTPIENIVKDASQKAGAPITVTRFLRYKVGEE